MSAATTTTDPAAKADAARSASRSGPGTDEVDLAFSEAEPPPRRASEPAKPTPTRTTDPHPVSSREFERASTLPAPPPEGGGSKRKGTLTGMPNRMVEVTADDQRKLEDIRRKLKDIFVTAEKKPPPPEASSDTIKAGDQQTASSGLLDLRTLAAEHQNQKKKNEAARPDDDMLYMSGGLFGSERPAPTGPPDLAKPVPPPKPPPLTRLSSPGPAEVDEVEAEAEVPVLQSRPMPKRVTMPPPVAALDSIPMPSFRPGMSKGVIGALVVVGVLAVWIVVFMAMRGGEETAGGPQASATTENAPSGAPAQVDTSQAVVSPSKPSEGAGTKVVTPGEKTPPDKSKPEKEKGDTKGDKTDSKSPKTDTKTAKSTGDAPEKVAKPEPEAPKPVAPASNGEFNRTAASSAMSAAAARAMGCKGDGPSGTASVSVTFAPSGRVTSARVDGPPFSGTPTGGCIATAFRSVSVPPFDGSSITVRKTVSIR